MKKQGTFFTNAMLVSFGGLLAKIIGAFYRVPLTNALGGYGVGLYHMAYPLFVLFLTLSSSGIPSAFAGIIAKEVATGRERGETLSTALKLFSLLGLTGTLSMCLFAPAMGKLQGNSDLVGCYLALAPSVFFVALIAVLRGYFQGKHDMLPTAVSNIVEQVVKACFGLLFATRFSSPARAVRYALFAVTLSEAVTLCYLLIRIKNREKSRFLPRKESSKRKLFGAVLPVMLATCLLPLSQTADSVIIVRLLARHTRESVTLFGLFSGGISLVGLPVALCSGLATAVVPSVSAYFACGKEKEGRKRALFALSLTLSCALPCALGLLFGNKLIVKILFPSLVGADAELLGKILRALSISAFFLAGVETLASCLTGMGRAKYSARSMAVAVAVKHALQFLLLPNPAISVFGAVIALNACYPIAFFLNLFYTIKKKRVKRYDYGYRSWRGNGRRFGARVKAYEGGGQSVSPHRVATLRAGADAGRN